MDAMAVASSISLTGISTALATRNLSSSAAFSSTSALGPKLSVSRRVSASSTRCIAEPAEKLCKFLECKAVIDSFYLLLFSDDLLRVLFQLTPLP